MEIERTGLEKSFYEMCNKVVVEKGYELYDMDYVKGQKTLRLFIMDKKTQSAVIEDCILVDKALSPSFEENEWIPEDIILEVSSPGVYRRLRTKEHFELSLEKRIQIKYRGELDLCDDLKKEKELKNKILEGYLKAVTSKEEELILNIDVELKKKTVNIDININKIVKANWEPKL